MTFYYRCSECGELFDIDPAIMLCPVCSKMQLPDKPLRGILEVGWEGRAPKNPSPFDLLPVPKECFPPIPVGNTPLWEPELMRKKLGFPKLYLKDDSLNPTGSLKDRASYLVAAFCRRHGIKNVVLASTGNAGSSMAGVGAAAGLAVTLFIPKSAPQAKLVQALQYGAELILVDGSYDKAYDLSLDHSKTVGALSRNTAYNPMTIEGKKTAAMEIVNQLKFPPDYIFVPAGDGVILSGVYKGFRDLRRIGRIQRIPKIFAVQADGSQAISRAYLTGDFSGPVKSNTLADSLSVDVPRGGYYALKQLREHGGSCVTVSDHEILLAQKELASECGLFAEPAAAASLAGFLKAKETIPRNSTVILLITGSGLKDVVSAGKIVKHVRPSK